MITIIPAIDIKDGCCVRLSQGQAEEKVVYADDPVDMAKRWVDEGADYLHIVDLDGAFKGLPVHTNIIKKIVKAVAVSVEVGGGLRTDEDIRNLLDCGVDRAIIGTRALGNLSELTTMADNFTSNLAVGIDAKDGLVCVKGWVDRTKKRAVDLAMDMDSIGIQTLIYTDISKDGMLAGPNINAVRKVCENVKCDIIASGGITSVEDIRAIKVLRQGNLRGAIVGKALYERSVSLKDLLKEVSD